ncbi:DUF6249 domain-containing protein [Bacteroidota bacterium]|nr:hypothetical protein [Gammaproteobacteria bacterium]MDA9715797.1 DUF6249 domain-containing protein [Bacteroidota bacterium]|tara:strand:+ start:321 stop:866 length:546 start_codon:yes stop_codon:yes gene_type:complete
MDLIFLIGEFINKLANYLIGFIDYLASYFIQISSVEENGIISDLVFQSAASDGGFGFIIGLFFVIIFFGTPIWIILIVNHYKNKRAEQLHNTLQVALQNGQELSVDIIKSMPGYDEKDNKRSPVQSGFIQLGVGTGLFFLGIFITQYLFNPISGVGTLIFCIGMGQIGYGLYRKAFYIKNA